jgi:hypothetical protein
MLRVQIPSPTSHPDWVTRKIICLLTCANEFVTVIRANMKQLKQSLPTTITNRWQKLPVQFVLPCEVTGGNLLMDEKRKY